jgi:hypothetical protein
MVGNTQAIGVHEVSTFARLLRADQMESGATTEERTRRERDNEHLHDEQYPLYGPEGLHRLRVHDCPITRFSIEYQAVKRGYMEHLRCTSKQYAQRSMSILRVI